MNPRAGTLPSFVVSEKREGGEGTPQRVSSPIFEKQSPLTGAHTMAVPGLSPSRGQGSGAPPLGMHGAPPWSPGGLGLTPALECRVCEEVGRRV